MPYTASHRDSQPDRGTTTCSARGFASASETAQQSAAAAAEPPQQAFVPPGRVQNAPAAPWTPTRELRKRNFLPRRMGHLMEVPSRCRPLFVKFKLITDNVYLLVPLHRSDPLVTCRAERLG